MDAIDFYNWWVEYLAVGFLLLGFVLSLLAKSAFISYVIITACGIVVGRVFYKKRNDLKIPFFIMVLVFIIGYIAGAAFRYGDIRVILALFISATILSNWLHKEGYIRSD